MKRYLEDFKPGRRLIARRMTVSQGARPELHVAARSLGTIDAIVDFLR